MSKRRRLDRELVRRQIATSREQAQQYINAKKVTVNGAIATKSANQVLAGDAIELLGPPPKYVGRGGHKLEAAIDTFNIEIAGKRAIDIGSSTGGFTDALLQAGASHVLALDVGTAQLHEKLRANDKVTVKEQTDIRTAELQTLGAPFDIVVIDVSFIGLAQIIEAVTQCCGQNGSVISLIKPQFEAGRAEANKTKGVIKDPEIWRRVLQEVHTTFTDSGLTVSDICVSPITGGSGNVEFFFAASKTAQPLTDIAAKIDAVIEAGQELN